MGILGAGVFAVLFYTSKSSTHVGPLPHKNGAKMSPLYKGQLSNSLFYKVFSGEREGALFFKKVPPRIYFPFFLRIPKARRRSGAIHAGERTKTIFIIKYHLSSSAAFSS
jgi:hypothetical protein